METLGSVSITVLLHRLIMLCAVMFETTWHTRSGLHLQARAPPLTAKTAQKQLKEHKKHNQGYWPDLSTTPRSQSDQACTELFRTHLIFWGSKQQPQKPKDQFLTSQWSGWETPQDTLRYVCVHPLKGQSFFVGKRKTYTTWARCCQSCGPSCIRACYTCYQYVWKIQREEAEHISLAPTRSASLSIHLSSYQADFNILLAAGRLPVTNWDG